MFHEGDDFTYQVWRLSPEIWNHPYQWTKGQVQLDHYPEVTYQVTETLTTVLTITDDWQDALYFLVDFFQHADRQWKRRVHCCGRH